SVTVVSYCWAIFQRLSPFSTSYSSADTFTAVAPATIILVASIMTHFFMGFPPLLSALPILAQLDRQYSYKTLKSLLQLCPLLLTNITTIIDLQQKSYIYSLMGINTNK